ncbi:L-aspartate oxidase [hydrothermal vent metagenome]|uniref:L-aspartate oxidase n=1 Tax=hydrothermal vent metagenome TaxID=652676 RepID=A0A3B1CSU5_9ZZZZ
MGKVQSDFLVIGSGVAGLTFALKAAAHGKVALVTKKELAESNTNYAQGGIAAVVAENDSFDLHIQDTIRTGQGLCHENAVRILVESGPLMIRELMDFGARFTVGDDSMFDLGREGGHSRRRIVHANDLTGAEIENALIQSVKASPNIMVFENHMAVDLVTKAKLFPDITVAGSDDDACIGAYVIESENGKIISFEAKATLLATGGSGKVYLYTSNPDIASGDGIAIAYRAGAEVANMEFMQFHPTCLYHPEAKSFLISEAVRGEGARLKFKDGSTFMEKYHEMGSLAPRDVVARAIDYEMKKRGDDCVYLDTTMIEPAKFSKRFPNIYSTCKKYGFDLTKEMIPVVPAAHYMCGGALTDIDAKTTIPGLFAAGETAHTGVHGANRLASNSLLEAVVFSDRAAKSAIELVKEFSGEVASIPAWDLGEAVDADEQVVITHMWDEIRRLMWNYVGIARTDKRLARAKNRIRLIRQEIEEYYWGFVVNTDLLELRNLALCAELIVDCAMMRKESRGLHYNLDYPEKDDQNFKHDSVLKITFAPSK